jgi:hypothetical protein
MANSKRRKKAAVRMLDRVLRIISRPEAGISLVAAGREVQNLQQRLRKLKRLVDDDPDELFWDRLQKTVIKVLKILPVRKH